MSTPRVRWLTLKALVLFILIDIGFKLAGFERVYQWITRTPSRRSGAVSATDPERVQATLAAVLQATRWYYRSRLDCLPKALALYSLLQAQNIRAELCFGVKRFPFAGHAWVLVNGQVVDDKPRQVRQYTVIAKTA